MANVGRKAFTLLELLVVIAIIILLVALVAPNLRGMRRAANTVLCANNLKEIGKAVRLRAAREVAGKICELRPTAWQSMLAPYVGYESNIYICPEYSGDTGQTQTIPITDLVYLNTTGPSGCNIEMDENTYIVKLSEPQYVAARAAGLISNAGSADHFPRANWPFNATEAEADGIYYLCMEDAGDWDYKDLVMKVTDNGDGTTELLFVSGYTIFVATMMDKQTNEKLVTIPAYQGNLGPPLTSNKRYVLDTGAMDTSYGMNGNVTSIRSEPGRILVLDYPWVVARTSHDWGAPKYDSDQDGVPDFARHSGKINVLFTGGAVKLMRPDEINPDDPNIETTYWGH